MLMNLLQAVLAKRAATTFHALVVDVEMQTTPPVPSLPQPGAETVVPASVLKALQTLPLKTLDVYPAAVLRPTHRTFPTVSRAQLGSEVRVLPTLVSAPQVVPS